MKKSSLFSVIAAGMGLAFPLQAQVVSSPLFADNAVLQEGMPVPVWGTAKDGETVTVAIDGQQETTTATQGKWRVTLKPLTAGGPYTMTISGENTVTLQNILVGEVWVCSGQSNMEKQVGPRPPQPEVANWKDEVAAANFPQIRLLNVDTHLASTPQGTFTTNGWAICSPQTVANFSAAAYFFGRDLYQKKNVPIGLITSYLGGTRIQPWMPRSAFEQTPALKDDLAELNRITDGANKDKAAYVPLATAWLAQVQAAQAAGQPLPDIPLTPGNPLASDPQTSTVLFNGMINPLIPYAMRGAIWYQGEANVGGDSSLYYDRLKAMVTSWRALWGEGDFSFFAVQICPWNGYGPNENEPLLWEAEERAMHDLPNAGLAGTMDIGMLDNIHPSDKQDVGKRLMLLALAKTYGDTTVVASGPKYDSIVVEGAQISVNFTDTGTGLASRDGQPLTLFEVAGSDGKFVPADATIDGNSVVVRSSAVPDPAAVRFAWTDQAMPNLMNKEGLPAFPFRSDAPAADTSAPGK
jgi:sialate O-acetylesterase